MYDEALGVKHPLPKEIELYPQFEEILLSYRFIYNWNQKKIVSAKKHPGNNFVHTYFVIKEVGVNAVYTASWKILAKLAE